MIRSGLLQLLSRISTSVVLVLTFFVGFNGPLVAQSFDHDTYPKLDFDFKSLELDLGLQPQNLRIDGAATYQIEANVNQADTVTLYAAHMEISAVTIDGNSADYSLHNDSLFVPLSEPAEAGQQYELFIRYSGNPKFGLLKNVHGTVWTSQLPKAERHWVPTVDNPHEELKATFNISVPSGYQVWATGQKMGQKAVSVDVMRYQFSSKGEVPASALALAVGKFDAESTSFGVKKINVAVEQVLSDSVDAKKLLQEAYGFAGKVEDSLKREFPYSRLNIIVLGDHGGETKQWGASTIFVYKNAGDLQTQIQRGIIAQWFGAYQREAQWSQGDAITLYQSQVYKTLVDSTRLLKQSEFPDMPTTVYSKFGTKSWNSWVQNWDGWQNDPIKSVIAEARNEILSRNPAVITWDDYAEYWYRKSGQPLFDIPEISISNDTESADSNPPKTEVADSVAYKVTYSLNEADGELKLKFEAMYGIYKELTTINAYEVYSNTTDTAEVTFTGSQDSVMLQVDPMISTLQLKAPDRPKLFLDEYKPAPFLIYEVRNAASVEQRAAAAKKLGYHANNPDLQLAIKDFMNQEIEPEVRAALLSSLAEITSGAAGTEETFLGALDSEHQSIRNAALMALQNYENNATVQDRVKSLALSTKGLRLFRKGLEVYSTIAPVEQFRSFAETVTQQDSVGQRSIYVIRQLANMGEVEEAVAQAGLFAGDEYSYDIRKTALQILIQHDHTPSDWLSRAKNLLDTSDPRIRYFVIKGLARNQDQEVRDYLSAYQQDEYDARVYKQIEKVLNS